MTAAAAASPLARTLPPLPDKVFDVIAPIVFQRSGIVVQGQKRGLMDSRLGKLCRELADSDWTRFAAMIEGDDALCDQITELMTTNHTSFWREAHHFEHLEAHARAHWIRRFSNRDTIRLWSAACSSGEEPYCMAATLAHVFGRTGGDVRILATDLSESMVRKVAAATYPAATVDPVPPAIRKSAFSIQGDVATVLPDVRRWVHPKPLNLLEQWPIKARFDAIFCCNVMIYFDGPTKDRLLDRLSLQLEIGGFIAIGHSERVSGPASSRLRCIGRTIYERVA